MKISRAVARRYAEALFNTLGPDDVEKAIKILRDITEALETNESFRDLLLDPTKDKNKVLNFVYEAFGVEDARLQRFLAVLREKKRLAGLKVILEVLREKLNESRGIREVVVYSALPLSTEMEESIKISLEKLLNAKVELMKYIDESLIAGLKMRVGDSILDASFKGYLKKIESEILGER
ncbi:MAG TPA: ATP synthase F1 subunit delta [Thermotogae bacterium]|nr:ATP synthase F1 subunit delta [Thermotogota bacterium]